MNISETDDPSLVGENCHILAKEDDGPRGSTVFPVERRDLYANLILLCANHHTLIDKAVSSFPAEELHKIKVKHEQWVITQLGTDRSLQEAEEYYAGLIDDWEKACDLENWGAWASWLISEQPRMRREVFDRLSKHLTWLASRIWSGQSAELENAFENFRLVLQDFLRVLYSEHNEDKEEKAILLRRFYKIRVWDEELYAYLLGKYCHQGDLICDLTLELTRAANLICDQFRKSVLNSYRIDEGAILVGLDPLIDHSIHERRPQYTFQELKSGVLYSCLDDFIESRGNRAFHYGVGRYPEFIRRHPKSTQ